MTFSLRDKTNIFFLSVCCCDEEEFRQTYVNNVIHSNVSLFSYCAKAARRLEYVWQVLILQNGQHHHRRERERQFLPAASTPASGGQMDK